MGIDPGTTTGVAVLDTDGGLVAWKSAKEFSRSDLTRFIISQGKPLVIATDVTPPPALVDKASSTFGAELFVPDEDLGTATKEQLVAELATEEMDSHARDALAAAVRAYREYRPLLQKAQRRFKASDLDEFRDQVIEEAVSGDSAVSDVIDDIETAAEAGEESDQNPEHAEAVDWERIAKKYRRQYQQKEEEAGRLREHQDELREENEKLREAKQELEEERHAEALQDELVSEWKDRAENRMKRIRKLENKVSELENRIRRYRMGLDFVHSGERVIKICSEREELQELEDRIAFVRKNLRVEPPEQLRIVLVEKEKDQEFYEEYGLQAVDYHDVRGLKLEDHYIVDEAALLDTVEEDEDSFIDWLEAYRQRDNEQAQ